MTAPLTLARGVFKPEGTRQGHNDVSRAYRIEWAITLHARNALETAVSALLTQREGATRLDPVTIDLETTEREDVAERLLNEEGN